MSETYFWKKTGEKEKAKNHLKVNGNRSTEVGAI